ncbi:MAG: hypothetical protein K6T87_16750 [Roseiflexus sp.]|uniref:neuraminidase-like domain-containing protein n=1 Tax=Roseiflexus sp. TaxID=2562120 RepID=UPI0025EB68BC|nr:neuraminidase-like domain-containing protein [Roseiflexus sp.]MCL6542207.1 hypothetical protein [Roseiflexus sp.]
MNKITFPLRRQMQGSKVADLQDALKLLLDRGLILREDEGARRELLVALRPERDRQSYDDVTARLVSMFQRERRLADAAGRFSGEVDEPTANALNALLKELGVLEGGEATCLDARYTVACRVVDGRGKPIAGLRIELLNMNPLSPPDRLGEPAITDAEGLATFRFKRSDFTEHPGEQGPDLFFRVFRDEVPLVYALPETPNEKGIIRNYRPQREPILLRVERHETLRGRVVTELGVPAAQVALRLYRLDFGGGTTLLAEAVTTEGGRYTLAYDPGAVEPVLEVRALKPDGSELKLTKPLQGLTEEERANLNLVIPAAVQPQEAEYRRLVKDLTPHVGELRKLAQARENGERQDITVLHRATGWDARLIALAALTERLAADREVGLPSEGLYGLLRAGLPSDKLLLAQVETDTVAEALNKVREAGIVALDDAAIAAFKQRFAAFSQRVRLKLPVPGSGATYGEMLRVSGLDEPTQKTFAEVFLRHRGEGAQLWQAAKEAGLSDVQIGRLQRQGKLAFLAGNSAKMTERLLQKDLADPVALVEQDFHRAETWKNEVFAAAGIPPERRVNLSEADRRKLAAAIPTAYAAETVEAQLDLYAEDMARKLRLSYPTQVLTRLMETDKTFQPLAGPPATLTLLKNATAQGFRLGETPVAAFLHSKPEVKGNLSDVEFQAAGQELKTLQRLYQITPDNESMPVLRAMGITAAYDVTAYSQEQFIAHYESKYSGIYGKLAPAGVPQLIYRKAQQVSEVTYNLFAVAKQIDSSGGFAVVSPPPEVREGVRNELIKYYPTLESLFGSMDFCECEHCRSVLSPAAYFVDLLQFVDIENQVWANFLAQWKATHGGQDYPHGKPYDVLVERRPDLPHIALTCENTHTALPYIDIVNEILEYYVAHGKLEDKAARDTGEATTAELLAEPQNVIREAYDALVQARYPLSLPFDRWLETARAFCNYFETPLHQILEVFRPTDDLFDATKAYDRAAIFVEALGLSPSEAAIFTDPSPLAKWHELYGFKTAAEATTEATDATTGQRTDLNSAKALSRRLGVTYKEIVEIVQTGFVNPELPKLALLYRLGVSIRDVRFYQDHKSFYEQNQDLIGQERSTLSPADQARFDALAQKVPNTNLTGWEVLNEVAGFEQRLQILAAEFNTPLNALQTAIANLPFGKALVLADPDAGCNFDLTTLQYADGAKAGPLDFLRINLFVRLWRKLGWSIEETDRALTSFIPAAALVNETTLPDWLQAALIYLAHLKALEEKVKVGKQSRIKLLTLWADIPTTGKKPLYARLFLTKSVLKTAPVFDHPLGQYLSDGSIKLKDHLRALQGALGLTAEDIAAILADAGKTLDDALSLANVSLLYRYGLLAKGLKLSVRELIVLKQLSGLDPFKPLHNQPLQTLDEDHPFSQTLAFVEAAEAVKASGLAIEDLDYLLRHRFDPTGKYRPNPVLTQALLKTLAKGIRAIHAEHAVPDDPAALSDEILQQKLSLILPPEVVTTFLAMLNGTVEYTAVQSGVLQTDSLPPSAFADQPAIRAVTYNSTRQEQRLTFREVLFDTQKNALKADLNPVLTAAQQTLFAALLDDVQQQARAFFDLHLRKQSGAQPESGFVENADYALLFAPAPQGLTEAQQQAHERQRRARLAQAFLPFLQQRLVRQFIVQMLTAQTGADAALVESLVTDDRLLQGADGKSLLTAFAATAERGVSAVFFDSADGSGAAQAASPIVASADTRLKDRQDADGNPLNAAGSARFEGYLEVATPGAYRLFIELDKQNAEAELRFAHLPEPVFIKGTAATDHDTLGDQSGEFLELQAGVPYRFTLELKNLNGGQARLLVQGETLPKGPLSQLKLYPAATWDAAERGLLLLGKSLQLVQGLGLSEREMRYILTHAADFGGVSLSELPTEAVGDSLAERTTTAQRFARFRRLAAYARLKREMAGSAEDLIDVFEANGTTAPDKLEKQVCPLIAKITRREAATVRATAESLFSNPAFTSERPLERLWEALQIVARFGVAPAALKAWTGLVDRTRTADERFVIARELRDTLKARFEDEAWQRVAQPIFDRLRQQSRDALAAHVMHQHGFARLEQLYEYFLIDPGMEPVVQTSRIRLAIASVQLFIQRCLLNLEPKVHPSTINAKQWEWMKRYRVWEANRKIFLFPENWLEPEFRDDKTHLFTELEGALLQGDVSSDLVEDAFLNYLKKLDELARLDICAMHIEDNPDPARRVLHVFGRTYSQPHKYFYRRYRNQMWTPWEPVTTEIEGDHLAPVVWRDRLYLFWVTFLEKPQQSTSDTKISDPTKGVTIPAPRKDIEAHLHWSEYVNSQWTTRESNPMNAPSPIVVRGVLSFDPSKVFVHVSKEYDTDGSELGVLIHLGNWSQALERATGGIFDPRFTMALAIAGGIATASPGLEFKFPPAPRDQSFYLAGRNSTPEAKNYQNPPANSFSSANAKVASRYKGSGAFKVSFREKITTESGKAPSAPSVVRDILGQGGAYTLLPADNELLPMGVSEDAYRTAANPEAVKAAIESGLGEIATLMRPVFYQDNRHTFFVEPSVTEKTIEQWQGWIPKIPQAEPWLPQFSFWKEIVVIPTWKSPLPDLVDPRVHPDIRINPVRDRDWLINPATVLKFDDVLVGPVGQPGLKIATDIAHGGLASQINANPGSEVSSAVVVEATHTFARSGLLVTGGGLNIIGSAGLNPALAQNFTELNRSGFVAGGPIGR